MNKKLKALGFGQKNLWFSSQEENSRINQYGVLSWEPQSICGGMSNVEWLKENGKEPIWTIILEWNRSGYIGNIEKEKKS